MNNHTLAHPGRICPGRYLALRIVYLAVVCVLFVFDIGPALDEDGNAQMPKIEFDGASVQYVFLESSIHTVEDVDHLVTGIPIHLNVLSSLVPRMP